MNVTAKENIEGLTLQCQMQMEGIRYLKRYIRRSFFWSRYRPYLDLICIQPGTCGNPLSIQVSKYANGIDPTRIRVYKKNYRLMFRERPKKNPYEDSKWCEILLRKGAKYLKRTFRKELKTHHLIVSTSMEFASICFIRKE